MFRSPFHTVILCCMVSLAPLSQAEKTLPPPAQSLSSARELDLSLALYRKLAPDSRRAASLQNTTFSPGGVIRLLQALELGSQGRTQKEISQVLKADSKRSAPAPASKVLKVATAVWTDPAHPLQEAFRTAASAAFGTHFATVPFQDKPETARKTINQWTSERTGGNIPEILSSQEVKNARLVLTDAAWFKDSWKEAFSPAKTLNADFTLPGGKKMSARFLTALRPARYARTAETEALALPFADPRYQCICLLPVLKKGQDAASALVTLERNLGPKLFTSFSAALTLQPSVDIRLPKVDFAALETDLVPVLKALNIQTLFSDAADLSPMCQGGSGLKVGKFKQLATFKMDEQGAEAAAATAAVVVTKSAMPREKPQPLRFHADRPCLLLIMDTVTGGVTFISRCARPAPAA